MICLAVDSSKTPHPLIRKALASTPIAELIGFTLGEVGEGRAVGSFQPGLQHANPMGTLHGGVLCDLADATMGMAFMSTLGDEESFTTLDLNINFFRPVWTGQLRSEARVIQRGRTTGYVECDVLDVSSGKLVAKASSKCMVLSGDAAKGR
jgi:uncharacterized protein (TIGR00369 family)